MKKIFLTIAIMVLMVFNANLALGAGLLETATGGLNTVGEKGFGQQEAAANQLPLIVGKVISIVLGLMGVLLVVYIIYGGFKWIMSKGDANAAKKGTDMITNAVIGLVIMLLAYAITSFVINRLALATGTAIQ